MIDHPVRLVYDFDTKQTTKVPFTAEEIKDKKKIEAEYTIQKIKEAEGQAAIEDAKTIVLDDSLDVFKRFNALLVVLNLLKDRK